MAKIGNDSQGGQLKSGFWVFSDRRGTEGINRKISIPFYYPQGFSKGSYDNAPALTHACKGMPNGSWMSNFVRKSFHKYILTKSGVGIFQKNEKSTTWGIIGRFKNVHIPQLVVLLPHLWEISKKYKWYIFTYLYTQFFYDLRHAYEDLSQHDVCNAKICCCPRGCSYTSASSN